VLTRGEPFEGGYLAEVARSECHLAGQARPSARVHPACTYVQNAHAQVQQYRRSSARQSRRPGCATACIRRPQPAARPPAASQPFQASTVEQRQSAKGASASPKRSAASHACPRARQARTLGERHPYVCKSRPSARGAWKRSCLSAQWPEAAAEIGSNGPPRAPRSPRARRRPPRERAPFAEWSGSGFYAGRTAAPSPAERRVGRRVSARRRPTPFLRQHAILT